MGKESQKRRREIDQSKLFDCIQRHPEWSAQRIADEMGYTSAAAVRRYIKRYINRGELRERVEVAPGPLRPLNHQFLIGVVTDQQIYRANQPGDFPEDADYRDQESLTAHLLNALDSDDLIVHDAILVLGADFDILLFLSAKNGIRDLAPMITSTLRRYRGVRNTITMSVGAWYRE